MCRNIKLLHNFAPPATEDEVRASALQYVRKLTGINAPSRANERVFQRAVEDITHLTMHLFADLEVSAPPRSREEERAKAMERGRKREVQLRARYGARA